MNLKTTLALLVLVAAGLALSLNPARQTMPAIDSRAELDTWTPGALERIEVRAGDQVTILERGESGWKLPGDFPIRTAEVNALVDLVGNLRSRFTPLPLKEYNLRAYGLDHPKVVLKIKTTAGAHRLELGEPSVNADPFERPTYARLDGKGEALRLPPGLIKQLNRPSDYYQQRRLFEGERVAKENDSGSPGGATPEKIERLAANKDLTIAIDQDARDKKDAFSLASDGKDWKVTRPSLDRPDPRALETLLSAVPDIWAEQFASVDRPAIASALAAPTGCLTDTLTALGWLDVTTPSALPRWLLVRSGLDKPEHTLTVAYAGGKTRTLEIGAVSSRNTKTVMRPAPPNPMGIPTPPIPDTVTEELRYARLKGNGQVFEIRADRLKDIFVPLETLRDPQVARFNTSDVQRVEITHKGQEIVLARDKDRWKLIRPIQADANRENINELLSKLSGMDARGKDVSYNPDPKTTGLDKPDAIIKLTLEEEIKKGDAKEKKTRTLTLQLGKEEGDKLYLRDVDYPRVNAVDKSLAGMAHRDVLAWRGKRLFDFLSTDLTEVVLHKGPETITLQQNDGKWTLTTPVTADADAGRSSQMASSLSTLEVLEYVNDHPTADQLETQYGLGKPTLTATLTLTDKTKPARTLKIGRARGPKNGYFGKLADGDSVFAVGNDIVDSLGRDSLAWRSKRLLEFAPADLNTLTIHRGDQTLTLHQTAGKWQLTAPAKADVDSERIGQITAALSNLEAAEYVANSAAADQLDPQYGLGKPALSVKLQFTDKAKPVQTLLLGKARSGKAELFGKLAGNPAVFAVNNSLGPTLDIDGLALLPKQLWQIPAVEITKVKVHKKGQEPYQLSHQPTGWQISGPFDAQAPTNRVVNLLAAIATPNCDSYKAFEAKDLTAYGLDKPSLDITVAGKDGKEHGLLVGSRIAEGNSSRFAKQTTSPTIFVINDALAGTIDRGALDLLDPVLVKMQPGQLERVLTRTGPDTLTLEKKGKSWQVLDTPASPFKADSETVGQVETAWLELTADRYAAYGPKADLPSFGLDKPAATITIKIRGPGEAPEFVEKTLELGKDAGKDGSRYARLDKSPGVVVLGGPTVKELTRGYLDYVNRSVLRFEASAVKQLKQERGPDKLEVTKAEEGWMLISPAKERADDKAMQALLAQLSDLRARRVAAFPAKDLKPFGLDAPQATITLGLTEDQKPSSFTIKIGKTAEDPSGDTFAQVEGNPAVVVLSANVVRPLLAGVLAFRDRTLAKFASADVIRLERDRRKATFAQVDGSWKLTEPLKGDADQDELDDFVNSLARLRADELVTEKPGPEALKKFGLDHPEARWRLQNGDKEVLDLHVGATEPNGSRRYARLASRDLVFLLDPRLSTKAMTEYRTRTVWGPPIDASQVDAVHFGYEKSPFTLERSGGAWQLAGNPDAKINAEAINDTLATLAGLRLQRYVMDKDADLQLYGLKTPVLRLEVTTKSGKRTLQIGSREGESQRRYARVEARGQSDVFVIAEADAVKLVRDLAAFSGTKSDSSQGAGSKN